MHDVDSDGREVMVVAHVDTIEIMHGRDARMIHFEVSAAQARRLAWFLVRWLVGTTWLGAREWVLRRAMRQAFTAAGKVRAKS
jgi:hypothetical protein